MELFVRTEEGVVRADRRLEGELLVRGLSVTYGYLGDKKKTNQSYIQNPEHDLYSDLLYCTGDIVRFDEGLCCFYVGRKDNQIKHLGNRIELGEVEAALTSISGVGEAVVLYNGAIVAMISLDEDVAIKLVRHALEKLVPGYMMPETIILMPGFPRTANGKYDRRALAIAIQDDLPVG